MTRRAPATDLFAKIASFTALRTAALRAALGKRRKEGVAAFLAGIETEVLRLERELNAGIYRPGPYRAFEICDPKRRIVSAAPFRDRVVHHALCAVIEPLFERGFVHDSYANRIGKGTHKAIDRFEQYRDRFRFVLRGDIYRYFPAIDHAILKQDVRRTVGCPRTLDLVDRIIDASNPQEPVELYFPGDDLFAPFSRRRGLPIGNLTSQLFANVFLDGLDHFCREALGAHGYLRYMDDFALFHDDPGVLQGWHDRLAAWLQRRRLKLHPRKTMILETAAPMRFLGIELIPDGRRRLPDDNIRRFRRRLRSLIDRYRAGSLEFDEITPPIRSWVAHARQADTGRLREAIFRGLFVHPPRRPDRADGMSSAAAPGTTIPGICARPTATGTTPETGTTTSASVWPARPRVGAAATTVAAGASGSVQARS